MRRVARRLVAGALLGPATVILCLRWVPPPTSSFMIQEKAARVFRGEKGPVRYQWVPMRSIAPGMALAVVAAEDQKFPRHWGFDLSSISDAVTRGARGGRLRGASTITQQVAKNLFLWPGRSYVRKGLEAYITVLLELLWPKKRILEVYLNVAEFGEGTYGVGAAALTMFGKSAAGLSMDEAARLAAVLPNPTTMSPRNPSPYVTERAAWIREQAGQLGQDYLRNL